MLSLDEAQTLERAIILTRKIELMAPAPIVKGQASDAAWALEEIAKHLLPASHRTQQRHGRHSNLQIRA